MFSCVVHIANTFKREGEIRGETETQRDRDRQTYRVRRDVYDADWIKSSYEPHRFIGRKAKSWKTAVFTPEMRSVG